MKILKLSTIACDGSDVFWIWLLWLLGAFILGGLIAWLLKPKEKSNPIVRDGLVNQEQPKQDFTKIEGIGPKIQGLLYENSIFSYQQLSEQKIVTLEKIIFDAGPAYTAHRGMTITWPAQAKLAEDNQWDELVKWQDMLKGGI